MVDVQQQEQPDRSVPSPERQADLEAAYEAHRDSGAPYNGVKIKTLGELQWIMQQRQWSGEHDASQPGPDYLPAGMQRANLREADLFQANLSRAHLFQANLSGADLATANLSQADLTAADLSEADFSYADLSGAHLEGANLSQADLIRANLSQADLTRANLHGTTYLSAANLSGARLDYADLCKAVFSYANLSGAHFEGANLSRAKLIWANLSGASLREANLRGSHLGDANLSGANLTGSILTDTTFTHYQGIPQWPALSATEQTTICETVTSHTTSPERLQALAWCWPGVLVPDLLAANPNTPADTLQDLAHRVPAAFLRNPVLPLLFLENPYWLTRKAAQNILAALAKQQVTLSAADTAMVQLIEHCAHADT